MRSNSAPSGIVVGLVLLVGVLAASTAALFIRLAYAAEGSGSVGLGLLLAAVRLSVASLILLLAWRGLRVLDIVGKRNPGMPALLVN
jgi:hypothetical protein